MAKQMKDDKVVKMCDMKTGECAEVFLIPSGSTAKKRLMEMGLVPKTKIVMERGSSMSGPVEIKVRGSSLALGRGLAGKILVRKD